MPLAHLHDFVREGIIGRFADTVYSITGYMTNAAAFADATAPRIAADMRAEEVDVALLVPV